MAVLRGPLWDLHCPEKKQKKRIGGVRIESPLPISSQNGFKGTTDSEISGIFTSQVAATNSRITSPTLDIEYKQPTSDSNVLWSNKDTKDWPWWKLAKKYFGLLRSITVPNGDSCSQPEKKGTKREVNLTSPLGAQIPELDTPHHMIRWSLVQSPLYHGLPMLFPWFFPWFFVVFPWSSNAFFLWFFPWFCGFPMVFPCFFPMVFPMVFPSFSHGFVGSWGLWSNWVAPGPSMPGQRSRPWWRGVPVAGGEWRADLVPQNHVKTGIYHQT